VDAGNCCQAGAGSPCVRMCECCECSDLPASGEWRFAAGGGRLNSADRANPTDRCKSIPFGGCVPAGVGQPKVIFDIN